MQNTEPHILFTELAAKKGKLGLIHLNRPQALNALSVDMIVNMLQQLTAWEHDSNIVAVIIQSNSDKAFCAGGDLKLLYYNGPQNYQNAIPFFELEYQLNLLIYNYSKPYIALLDGITMGGGLGISVHGDRVIASERLSMAMPETGIGVYPDVGMCYKFARLPHQWGMYCGLTGSIINVAEAITAELVHAFVSSKDLQKIVHDIAAQDLLEDPLPKIDQIIAKYKHEITDVPLHEFTHIIEECCAQESVEDIIMAFQEHPSEWAQQQAKLLWTRSPTSLKVTYKHILQCKNLTFIECLEQDLNLTISFAQQHDIYEGIRAALIDKTRDPKWQPATLAEVDDHKIDQMFTIKWQL